MFLGETCEEGHSADIDIKQEEVEKDIKQSSEGLDEIEENGIEIFLSHVKDLERQEDMVIESSNEIMRSCGFTNDKLCVNESIVEDKPFYGTVLNEVESSQAKYDDDCLSNEDQVELLQQKEFINSLLSGGNIFSRDQKIMSSHNEYAIE